MARKKVNDRDIVMLNSVGIGLGSIAGRLNCHHTTVTARLSILNIQPADTRRAFMEDIYDSLSNKQQEWLVNQLGPNVNIKDYIQSLIMDKYLEQNP